MSECVCVLCCVSVCVCVCVCCHVFCFLLSPSCCFCFFAVVVGGVRVNTILVYCVVLSKDGTFALVLMLFLCTQEHRGSQIKLKGVPSSIYHSYIHICTLFFAACCFYFILRSDTTQYDT